jgi:hypothetical protein
MTANCRLLQYEGSVQPVLTFKINHDDDDDDDNNNNNNNEQQH